MTNAEKEKIVNLEVALSMFSEFRDDLTKSDVGLSNVGNFKAVSTAASLGLSATEQANARSNIGITVMGASGSSHASGLVPDPGATAGTTKFLREDGTWLIPTPSVNTIASISNNVLTVDGTIPVHFFSINSSIADVVVNPLPAAGCTTHVVFTTAASNILINIEHTSTKVCPAGEDPDPISVPSGGYAELDFLSDGTKVYVRGI